MNRSLLQLFAVNTSSTDRLSRKHFLFFALALSFLTLSSRSRAVTPAPDGGYNGNNTAEGQDALFSLTIGGRNTACGFQALFNNTTGSYNTATGASALSSNTTGDENTAIGEDALRFNTTGHHNTAIGETALQANDIGFDNTANGAHALYSNITGSYNTACGVDALFFNRQGNYNTAIGWLALYSNDGASNTAIGMQALYSNAGSKGNVASGVNALYSNTTGDNNAACGVAALYSNTTGNNNIALGGNAGANLTTGSNNIEIGAPGVVGEANTIRIGKSTTQKKTFVAGIRGVTVASGVGVIVGTTGQLGTVVSSVRFKEAIKPMDKASEAILSLKPVTFRYKEELDLDKIPQFGLIAEEVEKVDPDLVVHGEDGKVNSVRYEAVNAMLLNEFLKEHRQVQELQSKARKDEATIEQQQKEIRALAASVKDQAATIQKIRTQLQIGKTSQLMADSR